MNLIYKCPFTSKVILTVDVEVVGTLNGETPCPDCKTSHPLSICIREQETTEPQKTVCFDFDGVLAAYDGWKDGAIGDPIPGGVALLKLCHEAGYRIEIATCRTHPEHAPSNDYQLRDIRKWLFDNKIPFDHIDCVGKPTANVYVDDRGMYFHQHAGKSLRGYGDLMFIEIKKRMGKGRAKPFLN